MFALKLSANRHATGFRHAFLNGLLLILVLFFANCSGAQKDDQPGYPLTGEIIDVVPERGVLIVRHDEIPGYMPAMTMEFVVSPGDLANAKAGQAIRARLIPTDDTFRLEQIWPNDKMSRGIIDQTSRKLVEDTSIRGSRAFREVGENLPSFALYDQNGDVLQADRLRGKKLVINFIYTRCPVPNMCPAATQRMIQLQAAAREAEVEDVQLISITLDPEYDTPGVLRQYAESYEIDTSNYSFLTGPKQAVIHLMEQFGILVDEEKGLSAHTLGTVVVDGSGTIRHRVFGSNWMVNDFLQSLQAIDGAAGSNSE
ncbi:MAG TPA: SCO family protein [Opitutales bacterium]|nr:SCO family protein [Opitutales bacterium]